MAAFTQTTIGVRVPHGLDGYWAIIRELHAIGSFTSNAVDERSYDDAANVRRYLRQLSKAGFVEVVRVEHCTNSQPIHFYRLIRNQKDAPHFDARGRLKPASAQKCIWTAMRTLKQFTLDDLAFAASTPATPISKAWAKRYITMLHAAGYLAVVQPANAGRHTGKPAVWRLKPAMNTGPLPPERRRIQASALWDANRKQLIGDVVAEAAS